MVGSVVGGIGSSAAVTSVDHRFLRALLLQAVLVMHIVLKGYLIDDIGRSDVWLILKGV